MPATLAEGICVDGAGLIKEMSMVPNKAVLVSDEGRVGDRLVAEEASGSASREAVAHVSLGIFSIASTKI